MKRFLAFILAASLVICLCGCGEAKKDSVDEEAATLYGGYIESIAWKYKNGYADIPHYSYAYKNVDGKGYPELILKSGNKIEFYQYGEGNVKPFSTYDFGEGTVRLLNSGDDDYNGIIFNVDDTVIINGGYMTIIEGHMQTEQLFKTSFVGDKKNEKTETVSEDKKLIELAKEAMEEDRDIVFEPIA